MAEQKNQDLNQLLKIRRDKLAELQANGKDPFQITKFNQNHHSLEVKNLYEAHEAELLKDRTEPEDSVFTLTGNSRVLWAIFPVQLLMPF